ncbi:MAG: SMI1/KNR4 family protein [Acidimicrobiia bacterium]|nr:SMI1/KNR4 family protein [Acidimicrobiia bacterium]
MTEDELLEALRLRASEPASRVDEHSTVLDLEEPGDLSRLLNLSHQLQENLDRLAVDGPESVDPAVIAMAEGLVEDMNSPAARELPGPADATTLDAAEAELGLRLPALLRAIYLEIANGGIGPGTGLLGVTGGWTPHGSTLVEEYHHSVEGPWDDWKWPSKLLPVADLGDGVSACVDTSRAGCPVLEWDAGDLDWDAEGPQAPDLVEVAPTLAAWLGAWLES